MWLIEGLTLPIGLLLLCYVLVSGTTVSASPGDLVKMALELIGVMTVLDLYRQRFLLDPRNEFGLYVRSALARMMPR